MLDRKNKGRRLVGNVSEKLWIKFEDLKNKEINDISNELIFCTLA